MPDRVEKVKASELDEGTGKPVMTSLQKNEKAY